jgi:hypothetical protein
LKESPAVQSLLAAQIVRHREQARFYLALFFVLGIGIVFVARDDLGTSSAISFSLRKPLIISSICCLGSLGYPGRRRWREPWVRWYPISVAPASNEGVSAGSDVLRDINRGVTFASRLRS